MTQPRSPVDQALDLFVFAPLGLALAVREELPKLIDKGRREAVPQVALARMLGQMAAGKGEQEARRVLDQLWSRIGAGPDATAATKPAPTGPAPTSPARTSNAPTSPPPAPAPPTAPVAKAAAEPAPSADDLAIPGYDALSAPQVVQRLSGLSPDELEAVRTYEAATRHRQTILGRIAQLQSPGS